MKKLLITAFTALILGLFAFSNITPTFAEPLPGTEVLTLTGTVEKILEEETSTINEVEGLYQKVEIKITSKGDYKNRKVTIENEYYGQVNPLTYKEGDKLVLTLIISEEKDTETGEVSVTETFYITDYDRTPAMLLLFIIFAALAILIGKIRGVFSLLSMVISFAVIFLFILPPIVQGADPVFTVIGYSLILIPITFYMTHGFQEKTTLAVISTAIALIITGLMSIIFVSMAHLTGFADEEAMLLSTTLGANYDMQRILLAGMIISMLGVLDDVTVSQAEVVKQLSEANKKMSIKELFAKAMSVGKTHIASMTNTLVLVYTGASFTLLMLFMNSEANAMEVLNLEMVATEIVRTLVGSIGLMLAVPLTTILAVYWEKRANKRSLPNNK